MKRYYVYKIEFLDSTYYIGYRGTSKDASDDFLVRYFSSSKKVQEKINEGISYKGVILYKDLEKDRAYNIEQELINSYINEPLCLNQTCYFGREGFGIISDDAKEKLRQTSKSRWEDPEYKERLRQKHIERWKSNPELKQRQIERLSGKKRPEHSKKLLGHPGHKKNKGIKKPEGFSEKISKAMAGKPKSQSHKEKLSGSKPRICRLTDKKEMSVNHYTRWIKSLVSAL